MTARTTIALATAADRDRIYRIRHAVYATELGQHPQNVAGVLTDPLDAFNIYIVAKREDEVLGFVAITPPAAGTYSVDKYFARNDVPVRFDGGLFEVRLLTIVPRARHQRLALLLMYAAFRLCESRGAHTIVGIGRLEVLDLYRRAGLRPVGRRIASGAVVYELMVASIADLRRQARELSPLLSRLESGVAWSVADVPYSGDDGCYHGGAFFDAVGDEFDDLSRAVRTINADVLDAWFPPAPTVLDAVRTHLAFALSTSPPSGSDGLRRVIARARDVDVESVLPGAGSSDLIFAALQQWVAPEARILILDPMYGEYAHVLEQVIGARVDCLTLARGSNYDVDEGRLAAALTTGYEWVVLVNPNSPTGRYLPGRRLRKLLEAAPRTTRIWIDETYVDFTGGESLERFAVQSPNVIVCKSMSKAYSLSGARVGYLVGPPAMIRGLRKRCPPWSVSLPAQIAAVEAFKAADYYAARWRETGPLRETLAVALRRLGWSVTTGCANFLLCEVPGDGPVAAEIVRAARTHGLFLREVTSMGRSMGPRHLRVAVKDRETNTRIVTILADVLEQLHRDVSPVVRAPHVSLAL